MLGAQDVDEELVATAVVDVCVVLELAKDKLHQSQRAIYKSFVTQGTMNRLPQKQETKGDLVVGVQDVDEELVAVAEVDV